MLYPIFPATTIHIIRLFIFKHTLSVSFPIFESTKVLSLNTKCHFSYSVLLIGQPFALITVAWTFLLEVGVDTYSLSKTVLEVAFVFVPSGVDYGGLSCVVTTGVLGYTK